ncbi:MAG: response regulator [Salinivirgaceae bacterium]|nr:response regulator [Salinivirgaceae bacterium]
MEKEFMIKLADQLKNKTVLIVEDEISSEQLLSIILQDLTKEILLARTGKEAVEMCTINKNIDLILMDIKLPIMNGYEATRKIREFNKDVIIVAQTAYAYPHDREQALEAGCNDYISKPINKKQLLEVIGNQFKE